MTEAEARSILIREGLIGGYYGPRYRSWHSVQDYMALHPRGRGLRQPHQLYEACRVYQAERSRTKSYRREDPV